MPRLEGGAPGACHFTSSARRNLIIGVEFAVYVSTILDEGSRNLFQDLQGGFMSRPAGANNGVVVGVNMTGDARPTLAARRYYTEWQAGEVVASGVKPAL